MNKFLRVIFIFLLFCLTIIPSEAVFLTSIVQDIPSFNYIVSQKHTDITLVQGDEDYYVVSQNSSNSELSNINKNDNSDLIFGEDAITEDNILKHYFFNKKVLEKNRVHNKISPTLKNTIYTRAP